MKRMKKVIAYSLIASLSVSLHSIQAGAYGETTEKSTLINDTKQITDSRHGKKTHGPARTPMILPKLC